MWQTIKDLSAVTLAFVAGLATGLIIELILVIGVLEYLGSMM